jgi:hypothetical protein
MNLNSILLRVMEVDSPLGIREGKVLSTQHAAATEQGRPARLDLPLLDFDADLHDRSKTE